MHSAPSRLVVRSPGLGVPWLALFAQRVFASVLVCMVPPPWAQGASVSLSWEAPELTWMPGSSVAVALSFPPLCRHGSSLSERVW
eukprot:gene10669-biopygen19823